MKFVHGLLPVLIPALLLLTLPPAGAARAAEQIDVTVSNDMVIDVARFPADGEYLMIWLAPDYGFRDTHRALAERLPAQGIEVWQADIAASLFLPGGSATLRGLDGGYVAELLEQAHRTTGKKIALAGDSYAALAVLNGAREWQRRRHPQAYLVGAVLFTPYTYASIPPLGEPPEYMPVVDATNLPLLIFQAQGSPSQQQFAQLLERLGKNGSPIYTRAVSGVMSLFYEQPASVAMQRLAESVPGDLRQLLPLLARHPVPAETIPLRETRARGSGIDIYLREFTGAGRPGEIVLPDVDGNRFEKRDYTGQVTLINFWASWCPPCVEEIPSLNRLKQKMAGRPFELISINFAEEQSTVAEFMRRVEVDFPVLLDLDGRYARDWGVISYPSTFVIDARGRIRYGVNAAIDWDDPELIGKLENLIE